MKNTEILELIISFGIFIVALISLVVDLINLAI